MMRALPAHHPGFARTSSGLCPHIIRALSAHHPGFARTSSGLRPDDRCIFTNNKKNQIIYMRLKTRQGKEALRAKKNISMNK
jgi:hypothetical protein